MVAIYSRLMQSLLSPHGVYAAADVDVALARVFGVGVRPLHIESALFEAMLSGWRSQQTARYLKAKTIRSNEVGVRRFQEQVGCWPWESDQLMHRVSDRFVQQPHERAAVP